jgi:hypothetical protein
MGIEKAQSSKLKAQSSKQQSRSGEVAKWRLAVILLAGARLGERVCFLRVCFGSTVG